jgi:tellurite resistance protein
MSAITREDLRTIFTFALHVARVDEDFAGLERNVLGHYVTLMRMTPEEKSQLSSSEVSLADGLKHLSSPEAATLLVHTLCAVAHADGVMHEKEVGFIRKVNEHIGEPVELLPFEDWQRYEQEVLDTLMAMG